MCASYVLVRCCLIKEIDIIGLGDYLRARIHSTLCVRANLIFYIIRRKWKDVMKETTLAWQFETTTPLGLRKVNKMIGKKWYLRESDYRADSISGPITDAARVCIFELGSTEFIVHLPLNGVRFFRKHDQSWWRARTLLPQNLPL